MADAQALSEAQRPLPTATDVIGYLGWVDSPRTRAQVQEHVTTVAALARSHTRGKGFGVGESASCTHDLAAVIVSAAARSAPNPSGAFRVEAGSVTATPARFDGFTLAELAVLNRYRVRVA